ncbi:serine/threonine/tyrosine-interacting-like protein 1 isoform X1 [Carcharodon carcharias]|uniref:serine/threonine/tyrosine-interacting-like protein 1 isoform X1 n=1 Tax=Carcharodon carcharias TaxID=13397 RepID=UPI001B7DCAB2|nr:serine/threonine/tyrosine-interacting-like protein 1 isoform X1 [Carcharodon carcharias]
MAGIIFCEATELYNLLNQYTRYSRLTEPIYLYLVDVRTKSQYDESHVITAKRARRDADGNYLLPQDIELECVKYCVVYDGHTKSSDEEGPAIQYATLLEVVSLQPIRVLNGGYEFFSACYPFFRTQKLFYVPQELDAFEPYPVEILPAKLYMGDFKQASNKQVEKNLKIKAYLNLCHAKEIIITEENITAVLHIPSSEETNFLSHFRMTCGFLDEQLDKGTVLVFSTLGISRCCTIVMAYLIHSQKISLKDSWAHVQKCKATIRPHRDFVHQLSKWEEVILKKNGTDVSDPYY